LKTKRTHDFADAEKMAGARNDDLLQAKEKNPEIAGGEYDDDANPGLLGISSSTQS
jgi:hypothetical protein